MSSILAQVYCSVQRNVPSRVAGLPVRNIDPYVTYDGEAARFVIFSNAQLTRPQVSAFIGKAVSSGTSQSFIDGQTLELTDSGVQVRHRGRTRQRNGAGTTPGTAAHAAYQQALADGPSDETRFACLSQPDCAYLYARDVDKSPRADTRKASAVDRDCAYLYARDVDNYPHPELAPRWRKGASLAGFTGPGREPSITERLLELIVN